LMQPRQRQGGRSKLSADPNGWTHDLGSEGEGYGH
jgi:hypothetical protein